MKSRNAGSRFLGKPSGKKLVTRRWLTLGVSLLMALVFAGLPTLRRADFSRQVSAKQGITPSATTTPGILYTVDSTGDGGNIGLATSCNDGTNHCTLRAAIQAANAQPTDDTIDFNIPTSGNNCNASGNCTIDLTAALPDLSTNINITGPGSDKLTVNRSTGGSYRIFNVTTTGTVTLSALAIFNGSAISAGGGILNFGSGTVNVTDCSLLSNSANSGGGISNNSTGTVNVTNSVFTNNGSTLSGGAIFNNSTGTVNITNTWIFSNQSSSIGGGVFNNTNGTVNVSNSTIDFNTAGTGGGLVNLSNGTVKVKSSIIALNEANSSGKDVFGNFTSNPTSGGFNLIGRRDGSTGFTAATDLTGTDSQPLDPQFAGIPPQSSPIQTLGCGSPAIDQGTSITLAGTTLFTDQRGAGFPRIFDDPAIPNATGSNGADIGAFERPGCPQLTFAVNTTSDADDVNQGDGLCDTEAGTAGQQCTLRAAIKESNPFFAGSTTINFAIPTSDPGFDPGTGRYTINLTKVLPDLSNNNVNIQGPGADKLTVQRNSSTEFRIFNVTTLGTVTLSGMTISNGLVASVEHAGGGIQNFNAGTVNVTNSTLSGNSVDGAGGGIYNSFGTVNVTNSTLSSNSAFRGGGIDNDFGTVNVTNSTLSSNFNVGTAGAGGGGIANFFGTVNVTNSTLSGNSTTGTGAGIVSFNSSSTVNIINSTVSRNSAAVSGGGISINNINNGNVITVNVRSSIIALNTAPPSNMAASSGPDVFGAFATQGYNLIGKTNGSTGFTNNVNNDQVGSSFAPLDPKLDPNGLKDNGGPTQTIALLFGSPAIDKGTSFGLLPGNLTTDQRGSSFPRTIDDPLITNATSADGTDIGAFEKQTITPTLQFSSATYSVNENAGTATITVTRANDTSVATTVNYATSNGTATAGSDYTATQGTLNFAGGETTKTFNVPILDDAINEPNETVNLTLSNPTGDATLGTPINAVLTILDNDPLPGLSINDVSVTEGNFGTTNANFAVSLSAVSGQTVTVNYATANGTATAGSDYVATSGTLTFTPGQTTKTVTVTGNGDTTVEPDETFFVDLSSPANATITRSRGTGTITNDDGPTIQFSAANYPVGEGAGRVDLTVTRSGSTSGPASVGFATSDTAGAVNCNIVGGVASSRCDYETSISTVRFAVGETSKTISVFIIDDSYLEGTETFTASLSNPTGAALGSPLTATVTITDNEIANGVNPIDTAGFFVRQHYLDFLNREPDSSGLAFWTNEITLCGSDQACIALKRINVSAAFYLSIEFQETGYLVERIYKASYGDATGLSTFGGPHQLSVPIVRLNEFLPDTQEIGQGVVVGQGNWQQQLEDNKNAFTSGFVQRSRFTSAFPVSMTPAQFVDALNANSGGALSTAERNQLVSDLTTNAKTRAQVLRAVAEDPGLNNAEFNRAFVLMQYFGYLRRNPNDPQDSDYTGYDFWLGKLNQFNGNFVNADMVKAFILSGEYRQRFGP